MPPFNQQYYRQVGVERRPLVITDHCVLFRLSFILSFISMNFKISVRSTMFIFRHTLHWDVARQAPAATLISYVSHTLCLN